MVRLLIVIVLVFATGSQSKGQPFRVDTLGRAPLVAYPVAMAFVPGGSGRFFFTEKNSGAVRVYDRGVQSDPFVVVPVEEEGEQGLLGIAVHPSYADTPYVFVYYTRKIDRSNVVERYRDSAGVGVDPQLVLVVPRRDDATINNGGALAFDRDARLYVGVGDYGTFPANAQDIVPKRNYWGKILRINMDGSIPVDNPIPGRAIWAYGVRDPRGITFDEETGEMFCTDGGTHGKNEIHRVEKEANLGWPLRSVGVKPICAFGGSEHPALTGIAVYRGEAFPRLKGKILVAGNMYPKLWVGTFSTEADSLDLTPFYTSNTGFADVRVSPSGSIYLTNGPYLGSRLIRLSPVAPEFVSSPPLVATEGELYSYTPSFAGTPPGLVLESGPVGMTVDSTTWSLRWIPTNSQALAGVTSATLRAENGAGSVEQRWRMRVVNVNDPPFPFALADTTSEAAFSFDGVEPVVELLWQPTTDPDGDSITYRVQLDTTLAFDSPLHRDTVVAKADTLHLLLPKASQSYYWRVAATDGRLVTFSTPNVKRLLVNYQNLPPANTERERSAAAESEAESASPPMPVSALKYTLPREGQVRLSIFNLLGQEVLRVFEGLQAEGVHEVALSSLSLPSGVYIYRLQAPGVFETRKVTISR